MSLDEIQLVVEDFDLSYEDHQLIHCGLRELLGLAPSRSRLVLTLKSEYQRFSGQLKTIGVSQRFQSNCDGDTLEIVFEELCKDLKRQLQRWKQARFVEPAS